MQHFEHKETTFNFTHTLKIFFSSFLLLQFIHEKEQLFFWCYIFFTHTKAVLVSGFLHFSASDQPLLYFTALKWENIWEIFLLEWAGPSTCLCKDISFRKMSFPNLNSALKRLCSTILTNLITNNWWWIFMLFHTWKYEYLHRIDWEGFKWGWELKSIFPHVRRWCHKILPSHCCSQYCL